MDVIGHAYGVLLTAAVIVLAVLVIFSMARSVLGPRIADRIIAINMTGTMIIMIIAVLSVFLDENYLVDICLIYAMISFLGVVVLCKVYTGVYLQKRNRKATLKAVEMNLAAQPEALPADPVKPAAQAGAKDGCGNGADTAGGRGRETL